MQKPPAAVLVARVAAAVSCVAADRQTSSSDAASASLTTQGPGQRRSAPLVTGADTNLFEVFNRKRKSF